MGLASVIDNSLYISPKLKPRFLLRAPPIPKSTHFPHNFPDIPRIQTGARSCRFSPVPSSRGTERPGDLSPTPSDEIKDNGSYTSAARNVALWVSTAVAFGIALGFKDGVGKASEFFAGYLLEQSLSVDNLFVFVLIFKYFKVPHTYQNRVLSYGIAGSVVFRLMIILIGTAALQKFEAVNLLLAAILLYSSIKLFASEEDDSDLSNNFVVKTCQRFIPVTANYDGNRFFTVQEGLQKVSNILGRQHLYFSRLILYQQCLVSHATLL